VANPFQNSLAIKAEMEQLRIAFIDADLDLCLTFVDVAETEYNMGHREHAERSRTNAEKGYYDMKRFFSQATEAARRKFTPEFINRLDKIVVFRSLGIEALRSILDLELDAITSRIQMAAPKPCSLEVMESARAFLLAEGTDARYGAGHLKRSIERLLVQPLSNLIASGQVRSRDCVRVAHNRNAQELDFFREVHGWDEEESNRSLAAA
jgi:ATP-dependent Clp protease ATP-binding subunit ClpA